MHFLNVICTAWRREDRLPQPCHPAGFLWLLTLAMLAQTASLSAVPYASGLTKRNGTVSFRLNESADEVKIISQGGASTNSLGALPAGLHSLALSNETPFEIVVSKVGAAGFLRPVEPNRGTVLQISPDSGATRFLSPRGLAVNNNPASPFFGRIYVANATAGTISSNSFGPARTIGDGIYVLNADFTDARGQGDAPLTGGLDFTAGRDLSPYRLSIGQDDNLYVCDFSDTNGGLYVVDADVSAGSGTNVLGGPAGSRFPVGLSGVHGSIAAAIVEGSLASSNLVAFVIDEDLQVDRSSTVRQTLNSLWRHELNSILPGAPDQMPELFIASSWVGFVTQVMDLSRGTNGFFFVNDYRATGNDWAGLYVHDPFGDPVWNSLTASRALLKDANAPDILKGTGGGALSPAGDFTAVINLDTSVMTVLPIVDGLPDLKNYLTLDGFGTGVTQGRDVAWDMAGNLYAISGGAQSLRVFSPGGKTTAITGSDGTFRLHRPPAVSVTAPAPVAYESGEPGFFSIRRAVDTDEDLIVAFTLTGSASLGVDYVVDQLQAVIPAGSSVVDIPVSAVDDAISEPVENVTLSLSASPDFDPRSPTTATITIADNDPIVVSVHALDSTAYERLPGDTLSFAIERQGRTDTDLLIRYSTSAGSASEDIDYSVTASVAGPGQINLPAGGTNVTLVIQPVDDAEFEADETVVITLLGGGDNYFTGSADVASGVITDNDAPLAGILFADGFETDTSTNWIVRFGANNGIYDADVRWSFDYGAIGIPPAPGTQDGTTHGLFVQVNKTNSTAGGSAGINLYPLAGSYSGNYALKFDMLINASPSSPTEHALAGLNHSALLTNRVTQSTDSNATTRGGDGIFVAIESDASNNRDWAAYSFYGTDSFPFLLTNRTSASLSSILPSPPYAFAGSPGVGPGTAKIWTDVELGQSNGVVTLRVNNSAVYSFTNITSFTGGNVMIGLNDQFDSVGGAGTNGNFVLFDNVRVVTLDVPVITRVELLPNNEIQIDFTCSWGGQPSDYHLQSASNPAGPGWSEETQVIGGITDSGFRFIAPRTEVVRFYRVRR